MGHSRGDGCAVWGGAAVSFGLCSSKQHPGRTRRRASRLSRPQSTAGAPKQKARSTASGPFSWGCWESLAVIVVNAGQCVVGCGELAVITVAGGVLGLVDLSARLVLVAEDVEGCVEQQGVLRFDLI